MAEPRDAPMCAVSCQSQNGGGWSGTRFGTNQKSAGNGGRIVGGSPQVDFGAPLRF